MQGLLFTQDFLSEGIKGTSEWQALDDAAVEAFRQRVLEIFRDFPVAGNPNEATTERRLIDPVLEALGWDRFLVQQAAARARSEVPDYLLFADAESFAAANRERRTERRYRFGISIVEAKRWERYLDQGREPDLFDDGVPSTQMLRYMSRIEVASERAIQWGILTNGRHWRLYFQGARSRSEEFLEIDLPAVAQVPDISRDLFSVPPAECAHQFRLFYLLFRQQAFLPAPEDGRSFHRVALDEGRLWEARVADSLSGVVFRTVFPSLMQALADHDPAAPQPLSGDYLQEVRTAALTLLYRLLFVLYAEDRGLLPAEDDRYDDYALRRLRQTVRDRFEDHDAFSASQRRLHAALNELFLAIHSGDEQIGLPPYNGGLFDPELHPLLGRTVIPDRTFAGILDELSRREEEGERKWINYRDLSVRQLGSIYERLLEFEASLDADGRIALRPQPFARKTSGSYYTHDDLVALILDRTIGPLLEERRAAFLAMARELRSSHRPKAERLRQLVEVDPASAFLQLRICDPAMGSGHFLVALVDYLADRTLEAIAESEAAIAWSDPDRPYRSPLTQRIADIRERILAQAQTHAWTVRREQLDDRHVVRRMILKRVVHGVDKNPMAVELAKVALWLHTFTVGAPLSFLDHHLRCGDSLFGEWVGPAMRELSDHYALLINPYVQQARGAARGMASIEALTDADITEVRASNTAFADIAEATLPLRAFLDLRHALRWLGVHQLDGRLAGPGLIALLEGAFGDPFRVIAGEIPLEGAEDRGTPNDLFVPPRPAEIPQNQRRPRDEEARREAAEWLGKARFLSGGEHFLHWQAAFPGVWSDWESAAPSGGFDAVIGNPPWDRMKLQEVEWFAARRAEIAHATRASDRKRMIEALEQMGDPLWRDYVEAKERAERSVQTAREMPDYPLLSGGDVNLYALFVERAHALVAPHGLVGLVVPSGIASDLGASAFFREISSGGRLGTLFDFENRRGFFPDVDSRFKFSVYVAGGPARTWPTAECAFYLHAVADLDDPERRFTLSPADFAQVNPNTGTAPVFRTRRDAELTTAIYRRVPVLVDRAHPERRVWPVRYFTMFHMTNDAGLFRTRAELEASGCYLTAGNRFRRGDDEYLPLYEGKMVQALDHRAASVVVNPQNLNRPAQPEQTTLAQHSATTWSPMPQFWVSAQAVGEKTAIQIPEDIGAEGAVETAPGWFIGFKDVTSPTNVRTMIAACIPKTAVGNTLPLLAPALPDVPDEDASEATWRDFVSEVTDAVDSYRLYAPLLLANLNSFAYDFLARQKVHGQHLNFFIVEQLPLIPEISFEQALGGSVIGNFVKDEVLRLSYTADDLTAFARDMGHDGPPFAWDEEDRRHRRARLDALFFHLYRIAREDAAYILDTFPIVRRDDEAAFGRYLTKDLILGYMNAVAAGDFETIIAV